MIPRLKKLVREIHRRSLWQVIAIYVAASWVVLQAVELLAEAAALPSWFLPLALGLLLIGLPIVLATAIVQEAPRNSSDSHDGRRPMYSGRHPGRPLAARPLLTWRRALGGGVLAFALFGIIATAYVGARGLGWIADPERDPAGASAEIALDPYLVAVLPFTVRGDPQLAYLGTGMVNLLSLTLDQAGEIRTVDPYALLGQTTAEAAEGLSPPEAEQLARRFGAGLYVRGTIVGSGGGFAVDAALYDVVSGGRTTTTATARSEDELHHVVDELGRELLAGAIRGESRHITRLAALSTRSVPALKAYLQGERAYEQADYQAAIDAFQEAIRADSAFALAYYRLSTAAAWTGIDVELAARSIARAAALADRLSERDRRLVEAFHSYFSWRHAETMRLYRALVERYPDDIEALVWMGDILFHTAFLFGGSVEEAAPYFRRVLDLRPHEIEPTMHYAQIAAIRRDRALVDSLADRYLKAGGYPVWGYGMRYARAVTGGDVEERERLLRELEDENNSLAIWIAAYMVGVGAADIQGVEDVAELLTGARRSQEARAAGHEMLAHAAMARGRWRTALAHLDRARVEDPASAITHRAALLALPFAPAGDDDVARTLRDLERWDAASVPERVSEIWFQPPADRYPSMREYFIGLLNARLGRADAARTSARRLAASDGGPFDPTFPRDLSLGIRADLALSAGESERALEALRGLEARAGYFLIYSSPVHALARERFLRAELLRETGRLEEALGWYAGFGGAGFYDFGYLGPATLRRAQINEALENDEEAARLYARFLDLWREADPELQPMVETARQSLEELSGEAGS